MCSICFFNSGIYLQYARKYMDADLIDTVGD